VSTLHRVCARHELSPGDCRIVEVGGRSIGVYNVNGEFHALLNRCPHGGAPLCRGMVSGLSSSEGPGRPVHWTKEGEIVRCPWHGWEYDIATGATVTEPVIRVKTFRVVVDDEDLLVELA
jgi:nitrite reductase/ring-hydroxylating ferredoxin subunit